MIILIILFCFLIRVLPRLKGLNGLDYDTYFHYALINKIKKNKYKIPKYWNNVVSLKSPIGYPYLYHLIVSIFPKKYWNKIESFSSAIFDSVLIFVTYLFLKKINFQFENACLLVAFLCASAIGFLRLGIGPRAYSGTPRTLGQLLYYVHIFTYIIYYLYGNEMYLLFSIVAASLIFITSYFATQVLIFFCILIVLSTNFNYLLFVIISYAISILISKGKCLSIFITYFKKLRFYTFYLKNIRADLNSKFHTSFKSYKKNIIDILYLVFKKKDFYNAVNLFFSERNFLHLFVFIYYPCSISIIYYTSTVSNITIEQKILLLWTIAGVLWYFLTKSKILKSFGEGERYLEFSLIPSTILLVDLLLKYESYFLIFIMIFYNLFSAMFFYLKAKNKFSLNNKKYDNLSLVFKKLESFEAGTVWPLIHLDWQCLYFLEDSCFKVVSNNGCPQLNLRDFNGLKEFMLIRGNYPYPSTNFKKVIKNYKVKYIVAENNAFEYYKKNILNKKDRDILNSIISKILIEDSFSLYEVQHII